MQFACHAVALAADGKLFLARRVLRELDVGLGQGTALGALGGHHACDDKADQRVDRRVDDNLEDERRPRQRTHQQRAERDQLSAGEEQDKPEHVAHVILPGHHHHAKEQEDKQRPPAFHGEEKGERGFGA